MKGGINKMGWKYKEHHKLKNSVEALKKEGNVFHKEEKKHYEKLEVFD